MWTTESINAFVREHPLRDGGSVSTPRVVLANKEDGDTWVEARVDFWPSNYNVVITALRFALEAVYKDQNSTSVYLERQHIVVLFFTHLCDPD